MKSVILITILLLASILYSFDVTYIVKLDGTGDFISIEEAVNAVQPGQYGRIVVDGPGIYTGSINRNISWNGATKNVYLIGMNDPVIDCQNTDWAFRIYNGTDLDVIRGLTIQNALSYDPYNYYNGNGLRITGGNPRIHDNVFINCGYYSHYSGGTYHGGAVHIANATGAELFNNSFIGNDACFGGAISILNSTMVIIRENTFVENHAALHIMDSQDIEVLENRFESNYTGVGGAALTFEPITVNNGYSGIIRNNVFLANYVNQYAPGGLLMYNPSVVLFHNNHADMNVPNNIDFSDNILAKNEGSQHYYVSVVCFQDRDEDFEINFTNNTFVNNSAFPSIIQDWRGYAAGNLQLTNILFSDNDYIVDHLLEGAFDIDYCLFSGYNEIASINSIINMGEGCLIDIDPLIDETDFSPIWDDSILSPVIDNGHPEIIDPDGTPSDIGAVRAIPHDYHTTDVIVHPLHRFRWLSFPVIDRYRHTQGEEALYILAPIEKQTDFFTIHTRIKINNQYYEFENVWDIPGGGFEPVWTSVYIETIDSRRGYKLHSSDNLEIPTPGFKMPDNALIELYEGENWVGYFVEESLAIQTALADIWDNLIAVYSEDWAYYAGPEPPERASMIYGKMYKIIVDSDCNLVYRRGTPVIPKEREMTDGFTYSEAPMYTVVNIEEIDDPDALEIGMFLDNECIGATVLDDDFVQILAFPQNNNLDGEVHFELYYGTRSNNRVIRDFTVYDPYAGGSRSGNLDLSPYKFNHIRLGETAPPVREFTSTHYPNPFNPETVINYSLPQESKVELTIYNIRGQRVNRLVNTEQPAGDYRVVWNGTNERGERVSSGVYFYRLTAGDRSLNRKMLLLK